MININSNIGFILTRVRCIAGFQLKTVATPTVALVCACRGGAVEKLIAVPGSYSEYYAYSNCIVYKQGVTNVIIKIFIRKDKNKNCIYESNAEDFEQCSRQGARRSGGKNAGPSTPGFGAAALPCP